MILTLFVFVEKMSFSRSVQLLRFLQIFVLRCAIPISNNSLTSINNSHLRKLYTKIKENLKTFFL